MRIIAHRGLWRKIETRNSIEALMDACQNGFGIETDVRDYNGELVISHNPPMGREPMLEEVLEYFKDKDLTLALNIKADGLAGAIHSLCCNLRSWFVFDMSIPDMVSQMKAGNPFFSRLSDVENNVILKDRCCGIWLDAFNSLWYDPNTIKRLLDRYGKVCIVSEELHGRSWSAQWSMIRTFVKNDNLILCTDMPKEARIFFWEDCYDKSHII